MSRPRGLAIAVLLALVPLGCDRTASFDTEPGEAFCGQIHLGSAYRTGFSPRVQMRLRFDSSKLGASEAAGRLATYDAGAESSKQRLLDEAALRAIPALEHDALSQLAFGEGNEQNLIFALSPSDPTAESILAVISLRSNEAVEARLIRPGASDETATEEGRQPLFGVFLLHREKGDCGF